MWRNDIKCKYMFMFPMKNLALKGLKWIFLSNPGQPLVPYFSNQVSAIHSTGTWSSNEGCPFRASSIEVNSNIPIIPVNFHLGHWELTYMYIHFISTISTETFQVVVSAHQHAEVAFKITTLKYEGKMWETHKYSIFWIPLCPSDAI